MSLARLLALGVLLGLALANSHGNSSGSGFTLSDGIEIIQVLSDPTQYIEYFPDTDRWIPWFGQRIREYKVPIILYNMGLILLAAGLAVLILQIFTGRQSLAEVLLRLVLVGVGWQLLVLPPSKNGCTANTENNYPCTVEVSSRVQRKSVLAPDGQGSYQVVTKDITVQEPRAPELSSHQLVKKLFKNVMLTGANNAIIASLKKEGEAVKKAQKVIVDLSLVAWSAAGAANMAEAAPIIFRCGLGGLVGHGGLFNGGGLGGAAVGCAVTSGSPEVARSVAGIMGTARSLLVMGPMLAIATFHAVNTVAGLYLYSVLFFMPLLIPLVLFGGTSILAGGSRLALVALVTPLISGVLLATGLGLSYSYSQSKFNELENMANDLEKAGIPLGAGGFALQNSNIASLQLYNLYQCLERDRASATLLTPVTTAMCDDQVSDFPPSLFGDTTNTGSVATEYRTLLNEAYAGQNPNSIQANGQHLSTVVTGQAFRRVIERATPRFAGGVLYSSLSDESKDRLYNELKSLFSGGDGASLSGNTEALLSFYKRYQAYPDLGPYPLYAVRNMMAANGMTPNQANAVVDGLRGVAFNPAALPDESMLETGDTWAATEEARYSLGLLNRIYAAERLDGEFQSKVMAALRNKMLNMVILMLTAVAITVVMLGLTSQLIGQLLMAGMAAGNAGLQMFMGTAGVVAQRESLTGGVFRGALRGGGGGPRPSYPAGPAPRS